MEKICRLCLSEEGTMEPIFKSTDKDLPKKIFDCTSIQVKNDERFPAYLCEICKSVLIIWMKFQRQCLRVNDILKVKFPELFAEEEPTKPNRADRENLEEFSIVASASSEAGAEEMEDNAEEVEDNVEDVEDNVDDDNVDADAEEEEEHYDEENLRELKQEGTDEEDERENGETIAIKIEAHQQFEEEQKFVEKLDDSTEGPHRKRMRRKKGDVVKVILPNSRVRYLTKCKICGKDQQNLKQHMRIHLDEKPYSCPYCAKAFRQRGNYTRHVNIHAGVKPYKCSECEVSFTDPASLRAHKVRHTGAREYHCDVCGKAFGHSHVLSAHKRIHTQDKRFQCSFCEKRFLSSHALKKHVRTHTGEKPYKCYICPKSFATSGNLSTHQRVHTKVRPYECNVCNQRFAYRCVLKTHMKTHMKDSGKQQEGEKQDELEIVKQENEEEETNDSEEDVYEVYVDMPEEEAST